VPVAFLHQLLPFVSGISQRQVLFVLLDWLLLYRAHYLGILVALVRENGLALGFCVNMVGVVLCSA